MLFAQSLGEYAAHGSGTSGLQRLVDGFRSTIETTSPSTWLVVGVVVLGALWLWSRRG